jgi:hypothetical protein
MDPPDLVPLGPPSRNRFSTLSGVILRVRLFGVDGDASTSVEVNHG